MSDYPSWICQSCGEHHGRPQKGGVSTWHIDPNDRCGWCGTNKKALTEPRDFGYPHPPLQKHEPT